MVDEGTRPKRYSEEFKLQAAKLIVEGGLSTAPKDIKVL
jgi:transposase-like protein